MAPLFVFIILNLFRTSYLPNEILWGHRFESMVLYRRDHNNFHINFSAFHGTYEVDTPTCNARMLDELYSKLVPNPSFNIVSDNITISAKLLLASGDQQPHGPGGHHFQWAHRPGPKGAEEPVHLLSATIKQQLHATERQP